MKQLGVIVLALVLGVVLARELWPRYRDVVRPVPRIVTVHDTLHDTLRIRGPKVVTTDTVNLVIRETVHDTVTVAPKTWVILSAQIGRQRGDTSRVVTMNLATQAAATIGVWTPGPLRSIWADSSPVPRIDFYDPPAPARVSFWTKAKWAGIGYGSCTLANAATSALGRR